MKTMLIGLILSCLLSSAFAQNNYFGVSTDAGYMTQPDFSNAESFPMAFSLHYGAQIAEFTSLRGGAEIVTSGFPGFALSLDALSSMPFQDSSSLYAGAGFGIGLGANGDVVVPLIELHGLLGTEFRFENIGAFVELEPSLYTFSLMGVSASAGLNVYF